MTYSDSPRYFHVVVTDETMDGRLEIKEVVGTNATVNGANVVADFTNIYKICCSNNMLLMQH